MQVSLTIPSQTDTKTAKRFERKDFLAMHTDSNTNHLKNKRRRNKTTRPSSTDRPFFFFGIPELKLGVRQENVTRQSVTSWLELGLLSRCHDDQEEMS
ncbi:hypothetical protein NPIL_12161 [Nephila pilipes]|uniref:Uncharacterized protein n=1 Tax=Nephila pilipes TaxID=299642 RepID=A0A8X6Q7C8_NEPPI|nr:hypothetical protein NPIL_12161 [Nephila pilipes]